MKRNHRSIAIALLCATTISCLLAGCSSKQEFTPEGAKTVVPPPPGGQAQGGGIPTGPKGK